MINNAGIAYGPITDVTRVADLSQAERLRFFAVNTVAPALLAKAVALALFLASEEATFITSEIVSCDGGSRIRQWRY